ncbi:MAG TPA: 16S rRNA (cytidine(1402)-2'-O)-methyltransferase [Limnochordia bacterium]|nr:16S rRNA (cytidine(1402)-2'-O)-methyltransferase [Limnochordia bacterium]
MPEAQTPGEPGTLFVCGTPIGNLDDVSPRLRATLAGVEVVAAEDTRRTRRLLNHLEINVSTVSFHEHNAVARTPELVDRLARGESVALVTDAGMPAISDPGATLVAAAHAARIPVRVIPGPSAVVCALALSGFSGDRFCFEGFLPAKGRDRSRRLQGIAAETRPVVLFEAPHRLQRTLADLAAAMPQREVAVCRELTKLYECVERGELSELAAAWSTREVKGEIVLVLGPGSGTPETAPEPAPSDGALAAEVAAAVAAGVLKTEAIKAVAEKYGLPRRRVYDAALVVKFRH